MGRNEQRAMAHLKRRLVKERGITDARKKTVSFSSFAVQCQHTSNRGYTNRQKGVRMNLSITCQSILLIPKEICTTQVAAELKRSLPHGMRAFERVSRTIQRLCNGYTSLPGLLEWGRITAARLEATTAAGSRHGHGGDVGGNRDANSVDITAHSSSLQASLSSVDSGSGTSFGGKHFSHTVGPTPSAAAAAAVTRTSGGKKRELWMIKHDDHRTDNDWGTRGEQLGSAARIGSTRGYATPASAYLDGTGSRSKGDGFGGGICASSVATASTASLPCRAPNFFVPSRHSSTAQGTAYYLPKKTTGVGGRHGREGGGDMRRWSKTPGHNSSGANSGGGVLCAAEYGAGCSDLSTLGSCHGGGGDGGGSCSSVASLLREERAFRQRNGALQG